MTLGLPGLRAALLVVLTGALSCPVSAFAQDMATVTAEENFRREPNGVVLAQLSAGARLRVIAHDGNWTQVALAGWVWMESLGASDDAAYDLTVSADEGENLRLRPSGTIVGRLEEGALLSEVSRQPSWAEVSRVGWIWTPSIDLGDAAPVESAPPPVPTGPAARVPGGFARVGDGGGPILTAPDGDTLAVASASSEVQVTEREGNWARVRVEGWMWMPVASEVDAALDEEAVALEPSDLAQDPTLHTGRVVTWTIQFISLERAEAVRTDFFEGEPFLLGRFGGGEGPFVYVAVPTDRLAEVEGLVPLERVEVTGRVRTAASSLTGVPILDLLSVERSREAP